jgi:hypothetical protein
VLRLSCRNERKLVGERHVKHPVSDKDGVQTHGVFDGELVEKKWYMGSDGKKDDSPTEIWTISDFELVLSESIIVNGCKGVVAMRLNKLYHGSLY